MHHRHPDVANLEAELVDRKRDIARAYREGPDEPIDDYELVTADGRAVTVSDLFGEHDDLIVIHNMGRDCPYCTMWADGFNGLVPHIEDRAAFVVTSPDEPTVLRSVAEDRGWSFDLVSTAGTSFTADLGFLEGDRYLPGISTLHRQGDGAIVRVASRPFGPFDDYCSAWNMFTLLHDGVGDWEPSVSYPS